MGNGFKSSTVGAGVPTIAGAGFSLSSPDKNIHIDMAMQIIPINILTLTTYHLQYLYWKNNIPSK